VRGVMNSSLEYPIARGVKKRSSVREGSRLRGRCAAIDSVAHCEVCVSGVCLKKRSGCAYFLWDRSTPFWRSCVNGPKVGKIGQKEPAAAEVAMIL
jgi:hypothetical protein